MLDIFSIDQVKAPLHIGLLLKSNFDNPFLSTSAIQPLDMVFQKSRPTFHF